MLWEFKRQKKDKVYCMYVLMGFLKDSKEYHVSLVGEEDLETRKEAFGELMGQHVYSVGPVRPASVDSIWAAELEKWKSLLGADTAEAENFMSGRWTHIKPPPIERKGFDELAFRPEYVSPKRATPETKWADSFQSMSKGDAVSATKRKIGFSEPVPIPSAAQPEAPKSAPKKTASASKKSGPMAKFVTSSSQTDEIASSQPVAAAPVVESHAPKGSLESFFGKASAVKKEEPKKQHEPQAAKDGPAAVEAKKPFFAPKKAAAAKSSPVKPAPPKTSLRLKKRGQSDPKSDVDDDDDELKLADSESSSESYQEPELPPVVEEDDKKQTKLTPSKKKKTKVEADTPAIDSGNWVKHLDAPSRPGGPPKIRVEVERVDDNGYTVFEEQWIDDPKWNPGKEVPPPISPLKAKRELDLKEDKSTPASSSEKPSKAAKVVDEPKEPAEPEQKAPPPAKKPGGILGFFAPKAAKK